MSNDLTREFVEHFSYLCVYDEGELVNVMINVKYLNKLYVETFEEVKRSVDPGKVVMTFSDLKEGEKGIQSAFEMITGREDKLTLKHRDAFDMLTAHPELFQK